MLILTMRTDQPEAEIGLYDDYERLIYKPWLAHRQLAETLHKTLQEMLKDQKYELSSIQAIVIFKGPGSFTGLRIGITIANTLAYSLRVPILATEDPDWITKGIDALLAGKNEKLALPEYGALPHITVQKK